MAGVPDVAVGGSPPMDNAMVNQPLFVPALVGREVTNLGTDVNDVITSQSACAPALIGKVAAELETVGITEVSGVGGADPPSVAVAAPVGVVPAGFQASQDLLESEGL